MIPALRLFGIFLRLGATSYGGPVGGMATFHQEFVERRRLISPDRYAEILTLAKLIPGPAATGMGIQIGRDLGGTRGGIAAGLGFMLPAFGLAIILSYGLGSLSQGAPSTTGFLNGARAAAWVLIALSLPALGRTIPWDRFTISLSVISAVFVFKNPSIEALVLIGAGLLAVLRQNLDAGTRALEGGSWIGAAVVATQGTSLTAAATATSAPLMPPSVLQIAGVCFKAGAFTFGTGLAVLPVLQGEFVERLSWVPLEDFMNAVTIGQITPGPVLITATVLGFQKAGVAGALAATLGAFLPSFLYVLLVVPRIWDRIRHLPSTRAFLSGAMPAVVGALGALTLKLFPADPFQGAAPILLLQLGLPAILAGVMLTRFEVPIWIVIPASGLAGAVLNLV